MRIAIVGTGNVGGTLGTRWAKAGHQVVFGAREPGSESVRKLTAEAGGTASAATVSEAVGRSEVVLLAVPWPAAREVAEGFGDLGGRVLIDATNPLKPDLSGLVLGTTTSAAEQVAQWARGARVVKAFNTVGFNIMAQPAFGSDRPVLFYCGDDAPAKAVVKQLAEGIGFDPQDAGPLRQARVLEPFAMLWISLAYGQGFGRDFAFKVLRR